MSVQVPTRHRAARLPLGESLVVLAATAVITGAASLTAVLTAPLSARTFLAWTLGVAAVLVCGSVTFATYGSQQIRQLRSRLAAGDAELIRMATETMPGTVARIREGMSAESVLAGIPRPASTAQQHLLYVFVNEVSREQRVRAATTSACASAAGRVQALATSMLADLREMEDRHDRITLGDLLKLDHTTAQAGRLADSIALLTGARSGRRWTKPIVMESILRGAIGRISAYQRVRVHSVSTVAIAGHAAEGVMHALAELMDNATSFSPPTEEVHVYVEEVSTGIVITIEDCGLVMSPAALARAERAVSAEPLDFTTLSGSRLGLAVVGCLARKHGLTVSFRPSSRGGTGVVVMIPQQLISHNIPAPRVTHSPAAAPHGRQAAPPAAPEQDEELHGLPRRRRGQTLAAAAPTSPAPAAGPEPRPTRPPSDAAAKFAAFHQASRARQIGEDGPR
ncbi:ATP-binding protein [Nonomuraea sp. 3-1Str]|uniref:ATP-binding protein n=1 Tax=Nonomuraea sp. 3-1Str TaxID=2929801 RepID=UPI00285E086D|nr:ATP-binding protein [Nonomuraea sp. 3-1Str]MDR8414987.1 ATP-binding protein [Nonomuraea sp. 3-1Str]